MVKIAILLLFLSVSFLNAKKLQVIASFNIIADIAKNVAKDSADVQSLTKLGTEIHSYEPTPKDILRARKADIILFNGLNLETWLSKFLDRTKKPSYDVSSGVSVIYADENSLIPNPHAWMSLKNGEIYVRNIQKIFSRHDPKNSEIYAKNADEYIQRLRNLDILFKTMLSGVQNRYLVTSEGAFSYLARDYDLKELYIWGINSDEEGTTRQIKDLIDKVKFYQIPVIFSESTISPKPAKTVANESGAKYGGVLYVDSLSKDIDTYEKMLETTILTIESGFKDAKN